MATATQPQTEQYSLTNPPKGATFEFEKVRTDRGKTDLGDVPILTWGDTEEDIAFAVAYYGPEGISNILGGTSLKVSFQGIARAGRDPEKKVKLTNEEIALKQIEFRPGRREGGVSTPASRLKSAANRAAGKANADVLAALLKMVEDKTLDPALLKQIGIENADQLYEPVSAAAEDNGAEGEGEAGELPQG